MTRSADSTRNLWSTPAYSGLKLSVLALVAVTSLVLLGSAEGKTIRGNDRSNTLRGTGRSDVLRGGAGSDRLYGKAGKDRLYGQSGNDRLYGGRGNDRISGGRGNDRIWGGPGSDHISGGSGNDRILPGGGRDVIYCGPGSDTVVGGGSSRISDDCEHGLGANSAPGQGQPPPAQQPTVITRTRTYKGTLSLSVHWYNICGTDLGVQTSTNPRLVVIGPPLQPTADSPDVPPAVGQETNPIHLLVDSDGSGGGSGPDALALVSALRFAGTSPSLILQYWNLNFNGTTLAGTLTNAHRAEAAAGNDLFSPKDVIECMPQYGLIPFVWAVEEGATLTGAVTDQTIQLHIVGNVVGGIRPFVADITATRVS